MNDSLKWILQSLSSLVMVGLALAGVLTVVVVTVPQVIDIWELRLKTIESKARLDEIAGTIDALSELDKSELDEKLVKVTEVLPETLDVSFVVSTINQIAEELDVNVREVAAVVYEEGSVVPSQDIPGLTGQPIEVTVNSTTSVLVDFLSKLGNVSPVLRAKDLSVARNTVDDTLDAKLVVESYAVMISPENNLFDRSNMHVFVLDATEENLYEELKKRQRYDFIPAETDGGGRLDPFVIR